MRSRIMRASSAALIGVVVIAGFVLATPGTGVTAIPIATGSLDPVNFVVKNGDWGAQLRTKGQSNLTVNEYRVAPGGMFGWHSHPGPSLVIVKSGTLTFYLGDDASCAAEVHPAGDAFVDEGTDVHIARNESTTEDAVVIVTALIPAGAPGRIDEADPGTCPF
jgi:quercetin dioxygenase-like cupin family protein